MTFRSYFFFSSRRRHTRCSRDWSSDVCSSDLAFTVDGPRGPARVAQPGALWLSGATGHPVLPFHIEASRAWTARSWDRSLVPKPFSTVAVAIGEPFEVQGTTAEAVEQARQDLEHRLAVLEQRCAALLTD